MTTAPPEELAWSAEAGAAEPNTVFFMKFESIILNPGRTGLYLREGGVL